MKAMNSLQNADLFLSKLLVASESSVPFANKNLDRQIREVTLTIKNELKVDYSKAVAFKPGEKERVTRIYVDYLISNKQDDFNSHYIQLLAWHLHELKIMPQKKGEKLSVFEYSPNPLWPFTVIEKTFQLFKKKRIDVTKVSYALILNYLNNYKIASGRYKNNLRKYLKSIKFSKNLDVYFNINNIIDYTVNKTSKMTIPEIPFSERLSKLRIQTRTLDTKYFTDAWFAWMFKVADLSNENYVLKNLNCSYFKNCNKDMQKIIMAKIIYVNAKRSLIITRTELICKKYIFPVIEEGNPLKKEFWELNYTGIYKEYLDYAWFFIEKTFVKNEAYKNMIHSEA